MSIMATAHSAAARRVTTLRRQLTTNNGDRPGPLSGVKVVEMCQMVSGPLGAMMLADQGASVVKVENHNRVGDRFRGSDPTYMPGA